MPQPKIWVSKCIMPPVKSLRWAEKRISVMSNPTTDMITPTTSSLRSGERDAHQEATVSGWRVAGGADFAFAAGDLRAALSLLFEEVNVFDFPAGLEEEDGVLSGMLRKSIAQMVCFSFATPSQIPCRSKTK